MKADLPQFDELERPFVLMNLAITADGKIATENRRISSFGSRHDAAHLYELRATVDAVMCGASTLNLGRVVLDIGPRRFLRQRIARGLASHHLRILVSGTGRLDPGAEVFRDRSSSIIVLTTERITTERRQCLEQVAAEVKAFGSQALDYVQALAWLHRQWGVKRLLCEGGGQLNQGLFDARLVDELHLTICPYVAAGRLAPTLADADGIQALESAVQLQCCSMRRVGREVMLTYRRSPLSATLSERH